MRKQVGLKFEDEDLARWDVWAESRGFSRTAFLEVAAEHLMVWEDALAKMADGPVPDLPGPRCSSYPLLPADPAQRLVVVNERNRRMQEFGIKRGLPTKEGSFGGRI